MALCSFFLVNPSLAQESGTTSRTQATEDSVTQTTPAERERALEPVSIDEGELGLAPEEVPFGTENPYGDVEEINIVGQAQDFLSQDQATSAVGFNEEELLLEGISDIRDLSNYTPNLEIKTAFAAVNPTLFIRGIGLDDFNANSASAVSIYQDGIYMNSPAGQLFGLYDIQTVEVLRGPQPTLTNATAGAIVVRSRLPSQNFEAHLTSTFGTYGTTDFQGAVNVPINETMAARVAFSVQQRDGVTYNACPDAIRYGNSLASQGKNLQEQRAAMGQCRAANGIGATGFPPGPNYFWDYENVNDTNNWAARALLSAKMPLPNGGEVDWLFNVNGGQNRSLATQYQHVGMAKINSSSIEVEDGREAKWYAFNPSTGEALRDVKAYRQDFTQGNNFAGEYDRIGKELLDILGGSATGTWQATDTLSLQSVTGYFWHDRHTYSNTDAGPKNWLNDDYGDSAWQVSQETSLTWMFGDANEAVLGGDFLHEALTAENLFRNSSTLNAPTYSQIYTQNTTQWAVYASVHMEFFEDLDLDASYRYNSATKDMKNRTFFLSGGGGGEANIGEAKDTFTGSTGQVALTYNFTEDKSVYVKYSRGWKPGHFNANTFRSTQIVSPVKPEKVNSYEAGLRTQWFDGLLSVNLTGFAYKYEDLQVFQLTTDPYGFVLRRLINSEVSNIWGLEWELNTEPIEGLYLGFNGGYLNSEYTNFETSFERRFLIQGAGFQTVQVGADYSGNRLIASPVWSLAGSIEYEIPISQFGTVRPRLSFAYKDDTYFDANEGCGAEGNLAECILMQPAYWILNGAISWASPDSRFEASIFVRNFLNQEYRVQSFDLTTSSNLVIDVYAQPRMAGAIITMRY